jgi:hypothetical protein
MNISATWCCVYTCRQLNGTKRCTKKPRHAPPHSTHSPSVPHTPAVLLSHNKKIVHHNTCFPPLQTHLNTKKMRIKAHFLALFQRLLTNQYIYHISNIRQSYHSSQPNRHITIHSSHVYNQP